MKARFKLWLWQWLIALDQFAGVGVAFWTFVIMGRGKAPNADETISSRVGRAAVAGKRWGLMSEGIINRLARWAGDAPDHCRRCIGS